MQHQQNQYRQNKGKYGQVQQREFEEAMELDRILEQERRQQSMQVFKSAQETKYSQYLQGLDVPNMKNASQGMSNVFGQADTGGAGK